MWTVSAIQQHPKAMIVCDEDATMELKVRAARETPIRGVYPPRGRRHLSGTGSREAFFAPPVFLSPADNPPSERSRRCATSRPSARRRRG